MKILSDAIKIVCLLAVILCGRTGLGIGEPVFIHMPDGHSTLTLTKSCGFFIFDLKSGGNFIIRQNQTDYPVEVPETGILFIDLKPNNPLMDAIMELQRASGFRMK
jgi:hypothetical protein